MTEIGKPHFFDLNVYYSMIDGYINSDEVETALYLMDNPPGYFRHFPPPELLAKKDRLHKQLFTPAQYKGIYKDVTIDEQHTKEHWPLRARRLEELMKGEGDYHLMELAPGSFWLPEGLKHKGLKFTYDYISLDESNYPITKPDPGSLRTKKIFACFELIEHLSDPWDIYRNYLKFGIDAQHIMLSTPLFTFNGGMPFWQERPLGHLRTYTPQELLDISKEMFRGYEWGCVCDNTIVVTGRLK